MSSLLGKPVPLLTAPTKGARKETMMSAVELHITHYNDIVWDNERICHVQLSTRGAETRRGIVVEFLDGILKGHVTEINVDIVETEDEEAE